MRRIVSPKEFDVCLFDGVTSTGVYRGSLDALKPVELNWREDPIGSDVCDTPYYVLTLDEIAEQIGRKGVVTVIVNGPLAAIVLQYGNYGDEWFELGTIAGYA